MSVNGDSTSPARRPGATWTIRSRPRARAIATTEPSGQEPVRRSIEDPGGLRELRLHRGERLQPRPVHEAIQVPPATSIADEVEDPVRRPLGLGDRFVRAARRQVGRTEKTVAPDGGDAQSGRIPGHVRVVPLEPRESRPVRGEPRGSEEVRALDEHARRPLPVERDLDDRGDGLAIARVVLTHGEEPAATGVEPEVRVPVVALGRDRLGLGHARVQTVEAAVRSIREDDGPAGDRVGPAAVFVDAGPHVERGGKHVLGGPIGSPPHEHAPAGLRGPALDPVDLVTVDPRLAETDRIAEQVLDPDRRRPAAVRQPRPLVRLVVRGRSLGVGRRSRVGHRVGTQLTCRAARRTRRPPAPRSSARARSRARRA